LRKYLKILESFFHKFSKWQQFSKWLKNWFLDHNPLSFEHFRTYFTEEKFFVRFKMASDVQDGGQNSNEQNFGIFPKCLRPVCVFVRNMNREHILLN
jgi:hypothetical protein